ncbi:hypothetical protein B0H10DRAFT_2021841, partial [Mycena sp. CBHHK59/15]
MLPFRVVSCELLLHHAQISALLSFENPDCRLPVIIIPDASFKEFQAGPCRVNLPTYLPISCFFGHQVCNQSGKLWLKMREYIP